MTTMKAARRLHRKDSYVEKRQTVDIEVKTSDGPKKIGTRSKLVDRRQVPGYVSFRTWARATPDRLPHPQPIPARPPGPGPQTPAQVQALGLALGLVVSARGGSRSVPISVHGSYSRN